MALKKNPQKAGKSSKKASVKLHSAIYKDAAVKQAALAYSSFAQFSFSKQGKYLTAVITGKNGPLPEHLTAEFVNLALFNSI